MKAPARSGRSIGAGLLASLVALVALVLVELGLRLFPVPPSALSPAAVLDRQGGLEEVERSVLEELRDEAPDALQANRIYRDDESTFWRLRSGLTVTGKNYLVPRAVRDQLPFTVTLNADGFRGPLVPRAKTPGTLRVVAVGDSSTFGWGVGDDETYPALLARQLATRLPGRPCEVMNAGVPGFTTFQGRRLLGDDILPRAPDWVLLAFGFNDSRPATTTDPVFAEERARPAARAARLLGRLELYRRLERLLRGGGVADRLSPARDARTTLRVPLEQFAANLRDMIGSVRAAGARPVVVVMVMPPEYRNALAGVATETDTLLLNAHGLLLTRIDEEAVRSAYADGIRRQTEAWRGVPESVWRNPAFADRMHPSPVGQALIADWLAQAIANLEAKRGG